MSDWEEETEVGQVESVSGVGASSSSNWSWDNKPFGVGRGFGGRGRGRGGERNGEPFKCYKCNEEGHMSRECPNSGNLRERPKGCFKCKEEGHMSRDCPNSGNRQCFKCNEEGHLSRDCPNSELGRERPKGCFKCGEEGHISRDCTNSGNGREKPKGCFKCHEEGHLSKDCPKAGGSGCHKCGDDGHFARDCPKSPEDCLQTKDVDEKPPPVTYIPPELDENQLFEQGVAAGINFSAFDNVSVKVSGKGEIPSKIDTFFESKLGSLLLENVVKAGYKKPTPIQKHALPLIMNGRDLMGCAQTGSGKTAAFLLPILHYILVNNIACHAYEDPVKPAALIVAPTRELAIQTFNEARKFSSGSILRVCIVYGGTSVSHQHKGLQKGCHVLVATPGRLLDYVERGRVAFGSLKFLVLDEADRMLDMGFKPAIDKIVNHNSTPSKDQRQTLMFSATFPEGIQQLAKMFLNDYVFVVTGIVGAASLDVKQILLNIEKFEKRETLLSFIKEQLSANDKEKILVFVETKRMADFIALYLSSSELSATSIHGDRFQNQREIALLEFKKGVRNILVATAVAARGLDIKGVGIVINYDMPKEIDEYVHRIGRTGRVGNPGRAISYFDEANDAHLAKGLLKLLDEGGQEVPNWLIECAKTASNETGYYGRDNFGSKDIRNRGIKTEEFPAAAAMGGPSPMNYSSVPDDEDFWG